MDWNAVVAKLLAKAEDKATTLEERQALTEKAAYVMAKYGITEMLAQPRNVPPSVDTQFFTLKRPYVSHRKTLLNGLSKAFSCRCVTYEDKVHVFGMPQDLLNFTTLFVSLWIQANNSLANAKRPDGVHGKTFNHSYLLGFISEVVYRVSKAAAKATEEAKTPSNALVFANRTNAVDEAVADVFPVLRKRRAAQATDYRSFNAGSRAGKMADIHQPRMGGSFQQRALR